MGFFTNKTLTSDGMDIMASGLNGATITFTKIALGSGTPSVADLTEVKQLAESKNELNINNIIRVGAKVLLTTTLRNTDVTETYNWQELGVFAKVDDGEEKLYLYGTSTEPNTISTESITESIIEIGVICGNTANVTAVIDDSLVFATKTELNEVKADVSENSSAINELESKLENVIITELTSDKVTKMTGYSKGSSSSSISTSDSLNTAIGKLEYGKVDGYNTTLRAGIGAEANGSYSTALGSYVIASGDYSTALGNGISNNGTLFNTEASGDYSTSIGRATTASGRLSLSLGYYTSATGENSVALGTSYGSLSNKDTDTHRTTASGTCSVALGYQATASGDYSTALGTCSNSLSANKTTASGNYSTALGYQSIASGSHSTALGVFATASGDYSSAIGNYETEASGKYSSALGYQAIASGVESTALGYKVTASGPCSTAIGRNGVTASGPYSTAFGSYETEASGNYSTALGYCSTSNGSYSTSLGYRSTSNYKYETALGVFNTVVDSVTSSTGNLFTIGNGTSTSNTSNAFRITYSGSVYGGSYSSSGADYGEYFEWQDGNLNNEDRIGYFVTLENDKIRIANETDDYILGVISGTGSIIGNCREEDWQGRYLYDEWGRPIFEDLVIPAEYETILNDERGEEEQILISEEHTINTMKLNPEYDNESKYIPRSQRKEWDVVGMLGQIYVRDDGTCEVGGYCKCGVNGVATKSDIKQGAYRVLKRMEDNIIKILFR